MDSLNEQFILRPMTLADLDQVSKIDFLSFATPWSRNTYLFELSENDNAHMFVLTVPAASTSMPASASAVSPESTGRLERLLQRLRLIAGDAFVPSATEEFVVGLGGSWCIVDEFHISTIAVHPDWRGRGLGEVLLSGMLRRGMAMGAVESLLEVRVSNRPALSLYRKYEYEVLSRRPRYYRDNGEDAWVMRADLRNHYHDRLMARIETLRRRVSFIDRTDGASA